MALKSSTIDKVLEKFVMSRMHLREMPRLTLKKRARRDSGKAAAAAASASVFPVQAVSKINQKVQWARIECSAP